MQGDAVLDDNDDDGLTESELVVLEQLIQGDFAAARATVRGAAPKQSPYRSIPSSDLQETSYLEVAIELLEKEQPVEAYFWVADAQKAQQPLEAAVLSAIGLACEAKGEKLLAYAAHADGLLSERALELLDEIPMDPSGIDQKLDELGVRHYTTALGERPDDVRSLEALAMRLERLGRESEAKEAARRALTHDPCHPEAHLILVSILAQEGQIALAEQACEDACMHCPGEVELWELRASLAEQDGQLELAVEYFEQALAIDERHWPAHLGIERVRMLGDDQNALLQQLRRMQPFADDDWDRISDAIDSLEGELLGGDAVYEGQRRVAARRAARADEIEKLIRGPASEPTPAQHSPTWRMVLGVGITLVLIGAFVLLFR